MNRFLVVALGQSYYPGELAISSFLRVDALGLVPSREEVMLELIRRRADAEVSDNPNDIFMVMRPDSFREYKYFEWDKIRAMMED